MKKKWKKEDLNSKHIEFSNKEEQNKLIKFLNSFGLKEEFEKNRGENDNCFYVSGSSDFYFTDNVKECELKYSDIFPEESFKQEQQFIVGKWHKLPNNINKAGNVIIYIKLKNITSDGYQEYSHRIVNNKGYEEYHDEVKTKIELLTDLSEIQQYLPSNHPDKVNTVSKQYQYEVVHCKTQQEWDFVCNTYNILKEIRFNIDTDSRGTANCINYNGKSWASLVWYQSENSLIYSFEEWCNGSSDIIEVGDEVEVINANSSNWYSNGVKYKVINVTNNGTRIHTDNDLSYWIQSNHCKVIKKASQIQHNERKVDEQLPNIAQNYEILDIFKPKSSKTMDFTAFQQQSPKELGKISKNKHLTI